MTRKTFVVFVAVLAIALGMTASLLAQPSDASIGTWELNVSKSKQIPGAVLKSQTRTYEMAGKQVKAVQKGIDAAGKPTLVQFTASYDGKDYPYSGSPLWDTLAVTWIDDHTASFVQKKNGKVMLTGRRVVSKDGKTMTITGNGTGADGKPTELLLVFDKR